MEANPFDAIADQNDAEPDVAPKPVQQREPEPANPFDAIAEKNDQPETSILGAAGAGAAKGLVPALAGVVPGTAAGAELGGAVGLTLGPVGGLAGAFVGGLAGGFAGGAAVGAAQDWALSQLPHGWTDPLHQYEQAAQEQHKTASFIGGLAPFALTSWPVGAAKAGETALQRLMADPITSRLFGGALMGGLELGQQKLRGEDADWTDVAISTGFGVMFNKPTALGEKLHKVGARAAQPAAKAFIEAVPAAARGRSQMMAGEVIARGKDLQRPDETTLADLWSTGIAGPGAVEETWRGEVRMADEARTAAQDAARNEMPPVVDVHAFARRMEPETFQRYDELVEQRDHIRSLIEEMSHPGDEALTTAQTRLADAMTALREHLEAAPGGYTGGAEARRLRAHVRLAQAEIGALEERRVAFNEGRGIETPEMAQARQHLLAIDYEMRDVGREMAAAYRRAAEHGGAEIVEPEIEAEVSVAPPAAPEQVGQVAPEVGQATPEITGVSTLAEQRQTIADDVKRQLVAAGRPEEEARAAGQLIAARYVTRANLFKGALGTPEELYRREGAEIRGVGQAAPPAPVSEPPPAAATPAVAVVEEPIFIGGKRVTGEFEAKLRDRIIEREAPELAPAEAEVGDKIFTTGGEEIKGPLAALIRARLAAEPAAEALVAPPAPLMPTIEKPEIAARAPVERLSEGGGIEALDPATIDVDAERFQFKAGGDAAGVTERLQGIEKWDPRLAGTALVWRDAEGKNWIADGHQRLGLAKRLSETQPGIKVNAFVLDAKEGITDSDARVIAAVKNIAEGSGTSIDAAKILKEAEGKKIDLPPLPPRSTLVREGQALARLSPEAFGMVVNEVVPTGQGALVGKLVADPMQQVEAMRVLSKAQPDNLRQAEMIVREILATGTEKMTRQGGLFGDEAFASSVVLERARIADEALKIIKRDKSTFRTLVSEAEGIQTYGRNVLDVAANVERLTADEQASQFLSKLATRKGPVSDELTEIARRLKSEEISRAEAGREFVGTVRRAIEGGLVEGPDAGGAVAGAAGERELAQEPQFEPGAEGKPQQLIPGVEPVTGRERAELAAGKPLQGGTAAPPEGGLFDEVARNQQELFQRDLAPMFRSAVAEAISGAKQEKASPEQWLATIKNTLGVKAEEMKWLGLAEWLKEQQGPVTRAQIEDYVRANSIDVQEVMRGGPPPPLPPEQQALVESATQKLNEGAQFLPSHVREDGGINLFRATNRDIRHWEKEGVITSAEAEAIRAYGPSKAPYERAPRYEKYRLPGGENYRELLLTLPPEKRSIEEAAREIYENFGRRGGEPAWEELGATGRQQYLDRAEQNFKNFEVKGATYKSPHWDEPNIVSHIRFDDRVGPNGEKVLHVAEIQSDWHQAGRKKGYGATEAEKARLEELTDNLAKWVDERAEARKTGDDARAQELTRKLIEQQPEFDALSEKQRGVPDAPFKTTWPELAMKRMIRYAAENGYDRISWDTGAVSADRYDLSKQISKIRLNKREDGNYYLTALDHQTNAVIDGKKIQLEELPDYIGKETADKLMSQEPRKNELLRKVTPDELKMTEDEYSRKFTDDNGRSVEVGKGTEREEAGAREYAVRYLNDRAEEINKRRSSQGIETRELSGLDLKVGGEGMVGFYDKILPAAVNKLVKKFGAKTQESVIGVGAKDREQVAPDARSQSEHDAEWTRLSADIRGARERLGPERDLDARDRIQTEIERLEGERDALHSKMVDETIERLTEPVHSIELTPQLADAALYEGFPLFQGARGKIRLAEGQRPIITLMRDANASTFIHETGHDWLEQLFRDSSHEMAPAALKDDATTVLDWLGAKSVEDIKTKHHEKFARGFEQYLREGVAPSKELAGVFAKFKNWLIQIYQTIKGLGAPINDDIRGVFDRMLADEPSRTVVAPERVRDTTLIDIHETDVKLTEPEDAHAAASLIAAERARYVNEPPPEIENEIRPVVEEIAEREAVAAGEPGAEPGADVGAGAGGLGEMVGGGQEARPVAKGGGMGAGGGTERQGGSATAPEGRGMGRGEQPVEPPVGSAERLAPRAWDNIIGKPNALESIDNLIKEVGSGDPDVEADLRTRAEAMDFSKVTNGRVTWDQHEEWARATGMPLDELTERRFGEAWNSRQVYFAAETINQLNQEIWQARQTGDAIANVVEYERKKALRDALMYQFVGGRAEIGRALNIFKALKQKFGDTLDETFFQTWREITGKEFSRSKDDSEAVSKLTNKDAVAQWLYANEKRTYGRMGFEYWMCSIVSNYVSQLTDTVGAFVTAANKLTFEVPVAATLGALRGGDERVRIGEAVAGWKAAPGALPAATKAALDTLRTGRLTELPGQQLQSSVDLGYYGVGEPLLEGARLADVKASAFGLVTGIHDAFRAMGAIQPGAPLIKAVHTERGMIPNLEIKGAEFQLGDFLRSPLNFLKSMEAFSAAMSFAIEKNMIAYRTAVNEGHKAEALETRIAELMTRPPKELLEEAVKEARQNALAYRGGKVAGALANLVNKFEVGGVPVGRFIVPFINISSIMMNEALLKRTPLGFLSKEIRADLVGDNGKIAQQKAQARMMVGTSIGLMAMGLAAGGMMTGSAPSDPKERALWQAAGKQPYSIKIGDSWYSYKRLGVFGLHLGVAADLFLVSQKAGEGEVANAAGTLIHAVAKNVIDQSYFKGPSDLLRAVTERGYGEYYVRNFLSGFVPFSGGLGQTAQLIDPYSRQARSVADAIMAKIPIVAESLPQKLDIFGRPLPSRDPWGPFAIWSQQQSKDPVLSEMMRLEYYPAQVDKKIRGIELTGDQHDEFARLAGAVAHENLNRIVASPQWSRLPDGIKKDLMETAVRRSRESVRGWMMSKYRDIPSRAYQLKRERLQ